MKNVSPLVIQVVIQGLLLGCAASPSGWTQKAGPSADKFLSASAALQKDMARAEKDYQNAFLYVSLLITQPQDAVGKDYASALVFAESLGSPYVTPDQLRANFQAKQDLLSGALNHDGDVARVLRDLRRDMDALNAASSQMTESAKKFLAAADGVESRLPEEITDQAQRVKMQNKITQSRQSLKEIYEKIPRFSQQTDELSDVIDILIDAVSN